MFVRVNAIFAVFAAAAILCPAASASSGAAIQDIPLNIYTGDDPTKALERFKVGLESTRHVNVGNDAICLYTWRDTFVTAPPNGGRVTNDRVWCRSWERILVEPVGDGLFTLQSFASGSYFSCGSDGVVGQSKTVGDTEKFALYFSYDTGNLGMYNLYREKWITAWNDGSMLCNQDHFLGWERFFGWKSGTPISWTPTDVWENVTQPYDNTQSDKPTDFTYYVQIGYVEAATPTASLTVDSEYVVPGPQMPDVFVAGIFTKTETNWSDVSEQTWKPAKWVEKTATAKPYSYATVYQAVGKYGVYSFHSNHIETVQST